MLIRFTSYQPIPISDNQLPRSAGGLQKFVELIVKIYSTHFISKYQFLFPCMLKTWTVAWLLQVRITV